MVIYNALKDMYRVRKERNNVSEDVIIYSKYLDLLKKTLKDLSEWEANTDLKNSCAEMHQILKHKYEQLIQSLDAVTDNFPTTLGVLSSAVTVQSLAIAMTHLTDERINL